LDKLVNYFMDVFHIKRPQTWGICKGTPRKMFGPKREGVTGNLGKLHSQQNHYLVDHFKNKTGGSCGSNGGADRYMQGFGEET